MPGVAIADHLGWHGRFFKDGSIMRHRANARGGGERITSMNLMPALSGLRGLAAAALVGVALTACSETITKHGHQFKENELAQVTPGMSQEQVKTVLGSPTTTAAVGTGSAFYYISSTQGQTVFLTPKEKDRRVLAVYFGQMGSVDRVAQYGLKDGKVFDYVKNETPSHTKDEGMLKSLFRNLGVKQLGLE
jgi:outer membrane protein assembly factor BamE (lipoprotein component of BamABCDE complex)